MIAFLTGFAIGMAIVYIAMSHIYKQDMEVEEFINERLTEEINYKSQKLRHYESEIKMLKGEMDSLDERLINYEQLVMDERLREMNDLKRALSTVYYDAETNKPFTLGDEEIVELGQL